MTIIYTAYGMRAKKIKYNPGKSRTKQALKDETDINFLVEKYNNSVDEHFKEYEGNYGEFAEMDYHQAMTQIAKASEMFDAIPSKIRSQFENNPGNFLDFVLNDENYDEMVEMGLAKAKPQLKPTEETAAAAAANVEATTTAEKPAEKTAEPVTT